MKPRYRGGCWPCKGQAQPRFEFGSAQPGQWWSGKVDAGAVLVFW